MAIAFLLAIVGGALSSTGANVLAWQSKTKREGRQWTTCQSTHFFALCFFLNLSGIGLFACACAMGGAVATVMPLQTASNLLANMFWQTFLNIKFFDKSMRIGTMILIIAVAELAQLGPNEPPDPDVYELMQRTEAIVWTAIMVLGTILSLVGAALTMGRPSEDMANLCCLTLVVSLTTVIGSSLSKCFSLVSGGVLAVVIACYFIDGVLVMGFTLLASSRCDVSIFIPAQLTSQLVFNMLTGYFIWEDAKYVQFQEAYICVYLLCIIAVYLMSPSVDKVGDLLRLQRIRQTMLSRNVSPSPLGRAFAKLSDLWKRHKRDPSVTGEVPSLQELEAAIRESLELGLETGFIKRNEIVNLTVELLQENGYAPNATVISWLERCDHFKIYSARDPAFTASLRDTLSQSEMKKLALIDSHLHHSNSELSTQPLSHSP